MPKPILTKIATKFQVTVPPEIRDLFDLQEGDLFQWEFDEIISQLHLIPKRAQLLTPRIRKMVNDRRAEVATQEAAVAAEKAKEEEAARAGDKKVARVAAGR